MNPLVMHGITKQYPGFRLGPIDLELPRGYVTGLVGANGAGKTTLMRIALGLAHADAGTVELAPLADVGVIYDVPALHPGWRVSDVDRLVAGFYDRWDAAEFDRIVAWAGIDPAKKVKDLSRGMGMKLQLAIALAHGANLLLFDEPTSGLDPLARSELLDMVAAFMEDEDHTVLFSSHITTDLEKLADHLLVMSDGRVVASGPLVDVVDGYRVVRGPQAALAPLTGLVLGLRRHGAGFDGLMRTEDTAGLPAGVVAEAPTLEQIVVALAKEGRHA